MSIVLAEIRAITDAKHRFYEALGDETGIRSPSR